MSKFGYMVACALLVLGCGTKSAVPQKATAVLVSAKQPQTGPYGDFITQFCGGWNAVNRANAPKFLEYYKAARALPDTLLADFPFRVLNDPTLASCWGVAAEVIGFAGDPSLVEKLLSHLQSLQAGKRWASLPEGPSIDIATNQAYASVGLAVSVARLGPQTAVSTRVVSFLVDCIEIDFWRAPLRSPVMRPEWFPNYGPAELEELLVSLAHRQAIRCIDALGVTGSPTGRVALEAFNLREKSKKRWAKNIRDGGIRRVTSALAKSRAIGRKGLEAYIRTNGGDF